MRAQYWISLVSNVPGWPMRWLRRIIHNRWTYHSLYRSRLFTQHRIFQEPIVFQLQRRFSLSSCSPFLLPPLIFTGLVLTLWTYKCLMMIIFQNKIIYMPSIPPFSRREKVEDYAPQTRPVVWREHDLQAEDGVALKMLEGRIESWGSPGIDKQKQVAVLYFQGNASSLPPRLPFLSNILKSIEAINATNTNAAGRSSVFSASPSSFSSSSASTTSHQIPSLEFKQGTSYTIYALSYRGFWRSRGRASQAGIELDVQAALKWLSRHVLNQKTLPTEGMAKLVLWGQSIGAGVATVGTATAMAATQTKRNDARISGAHAASKSSSGLVHGLILETPFLSMRHMLSALYPQPFLPYKYLWPFLSSTWDSIAAMKTIGQFNKRCRESAQDINENGNNNAHHCYSHSSLPHASTPSSTESVQLSNVLILQAGKDELVPAWHAERLEQLCRRYLGDGSGLDSSEEQQQRQQQQDPRQHKPQTYSKTSIQRVVIPNALHTEVMATKKGRDAVVDFLMKLSG